MRNPLPRCPACGTLIHPFVDGVKKHVVCEGCGRVIRFRGKGSPGKDSAPAIYDGPKLRPRHYAPRPGERMADDSLQADFLDTIVPEVVDLPPPEMELLDDEDAVMEDGFEEDDLEVESSAAIDENQDSPDAITAGSSLEMLEQAPAQSRDDVTRVDEGCMVFDPIDAVDEDNSKPVWPLDATYEEPAAHADPVPSVESGETEPPVWLEAILDRLSALERFADAYDDRLTALERGLDAIAAPHAAQQPDPASDNWNMLTNRVNMLEAMLEQAFATQSRIQDSPIIDGAPDPEALRAFLRGMMLNGPTQEARMEATRLSRGLFGSPQRRTGHDPASGGAPGNNAAG